MIKTQRGLNIPIAGAPRQAVHDARPVRSVAVLGGDHVGMKPAMSVQVGDVVKKGQPLFADKKIDKVVYTAPAGGMVSAINRGAKRALVSVVIDVDENEEAVEFPAIATDRPIDAAIIRERLLEAGLWSALRTRPFSRVAPPDGTPDAIFVTAIDTNPMAPNPAVTLTIHREDFARGVNLVARLTEGPVFVCTAPGVELGPIAADNVRQEVFVGPHPAGLVGTHIHFLWPVSGAGRSVWHIGYQDVIAMNKLFQHGELWTDRIISIAGPPASDPRLLRTRMGANLEELAAGEASADNVRLISGSVLSGVKAKGPTAFLGRYHQQLSMLREDRSRQLLGYLSPGKGKHSTLPIYLSRLFPRRRLDLTTTMNGSPRGMVPVGSYEAVMPLDILATQLLRALLTGDVEDAIALGCLELDEEDLALCTYSCPAKYEYGPVLRKMLTQIEKEG